MNVDGPWFIEPDTNRVVLFRGVNLSGGTKLPVGIPSHEPRGFWVDYDRKVNFVGRPFPIEDADEHLGRLVDYGFNLLRYIVTWEAIEHEGPGIYDDEYIDYVIAVLEKCRNHGIKVFIDPHQDTWSRHCGGSGHPGWTHTLVGLDPAQFSATQAAIVHNVYPEPERFPKMIWHTNHQKLAAATMFTMFFAGKIYAPKCIVNGMHVQDYLQNHYVRAFARLAKAIESNGLGGSVVIGYDTMNEPGQGYIGLKNITKLRDDDVDFKKGLTPTALQGMLLGSGVPQDVDNWVFAWNGPHKEKIIRVDPGEARAWLSDADRAAADEIFGWKRAEDWSAGCIWAAHGVYDIASKSVNRPDYFAFDPKTGEPADFNQHWLNFMMLYASAILEISPHTILFLQPPILEAPPTIPPSLKKLAYAPHWYDGLTLVKKQWCNYNVDYINLKRGKYGTGPLRFLRALRIGEKAIRRCFVDQIETLKTEGIQRIGDYPFILGEIGIPYDMENAKPSMMYRVWSWIMSFFVSRTKVKSVGGISSPDSPQNKAMDASINAAENNLVSYALWTYLPDNHPTWGDLWNGEDLSIWQSTTAKRVGSTDRALQDVATKDSDTLFQEPLDKCGLTEEEEEDNARYIISLLRPHPHKIAGAPISIQFTSPTYKARAAFDFTFRPSDDQTQGPTEIYVPSAYFPPLSSEMPTDVFVSHGTWEWDAPNNKYWMIRWFTENEEKESDVGLFQMRLTGITA